jgi:hypothetical protein
MQNHWRIEKLLDLEWDNDFLNARAIWAMDVGRRGGTSRPQRKERTS